MIINEISLKNFQCYYGDHNENRIVFSKGVNLIIGNNGGGKSKLFDAFYWVIYNQIFQSDSRSFITTSQYKENLISDKAKALAEDGKIVTTEVTLSVTDSTDRIFEVTRIYKAKKISDREWLGNQDSELFIAEIKNNFPQAVQRHKHEDILARIIPGHLKPYMWFQGEQVDSLMDLRNKSSLMQTINLLSDIKVYDDLISITKAGEDRANKELSKVRKDNSNDKAESERLATLEVKLRNDIQHFSESILEYKSAIERAKDGIEMLVSQVSDANRKIELKHKRIDAESKRKNSESELEKRLKLLNARLFSDLWLLKNVEPFSEKFMSKYSHYDKQHQRTLTLCDLTDQKLPIDMPHPVHLKNMLDAQECFVCRRPALEGSAEYKQIKLLHDREKPNVEEAFKNDCSDFFESLYKNTLGSIYLVKKLKNDISDELKIISALRVTNKTQAEIIKNIDREFEELLNDDSSENIVKEYRQHEANRTKYENLLKTSEASLRDANASLLDALSKQKRLSIGGVDPAVERAAEVWSSLFSLASSTKKFVFTELVGNLESAANRFFIQMTTRNRSFTGKLRLNIETEEKIIAEIVDGDGFKLTGSNDSNIILIKLALITAILKSQERWSQHYTMVTDAPTSKMASEYSRGFYDSLGENFIQSIVMTYDFLNDDDLHNLDDVNLGRIYRLEPQYPSGNREDRSDLSIKISEVVL